MKRPWPKLSETLLHPGSRDRCQNCGAVSRDLVTPLWCECDDQDEPLPVAISLCQSCERIIEPHPRLYVRIDQHQPFPGAMATCADCKHRAGLKCTNPIAIINGGPGLPVKFPNPQRYHVCASGGRGGWRTMWQGPPTCDAKEATA